MRALRSEETLMTPYSKKTDRVLVLVKLKIASFFLQSISGKIGEDRCCQRKICAGRSEGINLRLLRRVKTTFKGRDPGGCCFCKQASFFFLGS